MAERLTLVAALRVILAQLQTLHVQNGGPFAQVGFVPLMAPQFILSWPTFIQNFPVCLLHFQQHVDTSPAPDVDMGELQFEVVVGERNRAGIADAALGTDAPSEPGAIVLAQRTRALLRYQQPFLATYEQDGLLFVHTITHAYVGAAKDAASISLVALACSISCALEDEKAAPDVMATLDLRGDLDPTGPRHPADEEAEFIESKEHKTPVKKETVDLDE